VCGELLQGVTRNINNKHVGINGFIGALCRHNLSNMEREILYWSRFNYSIASFCQDILLENNSNENLIQSFTNEGKFYIFLFFLKI
jgi:hypothetical protein